MTVAMDKIVSLCKRRGIIFQNSEIYGGIGNTWDYGPLGVELKRNVKEAWWQAVVYERDDMEGLDAAILMNPITWQASGHLESFTDPLVDCKKCKHRFRLDDLGGAACPDCGGELTEARSFNLMFKTFVGPVEEEAAVTYLRPETAQGIFVNFKNIVRATRRKLPMGVAQIGKSFRNEITPGNFTFRTREFEQMELEFFCRPGEDLEWFGYWRAFCRDWLISLGMKEDNLRLRDHKPEELSHYSKATTDFEYRFPFGWGELWGVADRTDYDLTQHINTSGKSLEYFDPETNEKYIPYVIEPSLGVERLFLSIVTEAYDEEEIVSTDKNGNEKKETRTVMHFHPALAPFKAAVLPLVKKLTPKAEEVYDMLSKKFMVDFGEAGTIGKRYRRQDEIGTPFCITYDFDTLEKDNCVTVRDRDTMQQERVAIDDLVAYLEAKMQF